MAETEKKVKLRREKRSRKSTNKLVCLNLKRKKTANESERISLAHQKHT